MHLTDAAIRRLPTPAKGNKVYYDTSVKGFGVRVTASGAHSFVVNYVTKAGRERRITIGSATNWQTTAARAEAKRLKQLIDQGGDPLADVEAERGAPTVADLIDRFDQEHLARKAPGTAADYRRMLANHIRPHFGPHAKVTDVTFSDVDALHRKITKTGASYAANRCVAVISKMFTLAIKWRMRSDNPAKGVERNAEQKRKRYPTQQENERLTKALDEHPDQQAADIIRLMRLTGCRVGEARSVRWANIDLTRGLWTKPGSTTKQRTDHVVPLSAPARELLKEIRRRTNSPWVFPADSAPGHRVAINKNWIVICKSARITSLRIHDLRHGFASQLVSSGASLPLIGSLLGHSNPLTTSRYSHLYDSPQREAVEHIGALIAGKSQAERGRR
jgi:integrase